MIWPSKPNADPQIVIVARLGAVAEFRIMPSRACRPEPNTTDQSLQIAEIHRVVESYPQKVCK